VVLTEWLRFRGMDRAASAASCTARTSSIPQPARPRDPAPRRPHLEWDRPIGGVKQHGVEAERMPQASYLPQPCATDLDLRRRPHLVCGYSSTAAAVLTTIGERLAAPFGRLRPVSLARLKHT
jgi:hypothetical protein